jgi:TPR repeat protein
MQQQKLCICFINFNEAATKFNHASSQTYLGLMYAGRHGVLTNHNQANYWFRKAALQLDSEAQYCIGDVYRDGTFIEQDYDHSLLWYTKASDQGRAGAQFAIGNFYNFGVFDVQQSNQ